jgi:hypothetical protein
MAPVTGGDRRATICRLTDACPSFPDWQQDDFYFDSKGNPLGHLVMIQLAGHLIDRLEQRDTTELEKVLREAERIVTEGDDRATDQPRLMSYEHDMVLTGLIEGLYNIGNVTSDRGGRVRLKSMRELLGPECLWWWIAWDMWCRERKWPGQESTRQPSATEAARGRSRTGRGSKRSPRKR